MEPKLLIKHLMNFLLQLTLNADFEHWINLMRNDRFYN